MRDVLDTHCHTVVSGHAYSTLREMTESARKKGLELLAVTEHAPAMPGTCSKMYFCNFRVIHRDDYGIKLLMGVELNILDYKGTIDLEERFLKKVDIVIASLHDICIKPGTKEENTEAVIGAMKNPYVNIIGHPDNARFPLDYEKVVLAAKENHVLLELNNSSLVPGGARANARELDVEMLTLCKKYGVSIVIGSDAHVDSDAGRHDLALALLEEIDFPEELVVNRSVEALASFLKDGVIC